MKKLMLIICGLGLVHLALAQQTIERSVMSSTGSSEASSSTYSLEYTTGELVVGEDTQGSYSMNKGFQQGELMIVSSVKDFKDDRFADFQIFPVPTHQWLTIKGDELAAGEYELSLVNINGQRLQVKQFNTPDTFELDLGYLSEGTYMLHIRAKDTNAMHTWKVIKVN